MLKIIIFVTGLLLSTSFIASAWDDWWCDRIGLSCLHGCCDDPSALYRKFICCEPPYEPDESVVLYLATPIIVVVGLTLIFVVSEIIANCMLKNNPNRVHVATVPDEYQPTGIQKHPYPTGIQPPPVAGPSAPSPHPSGTQHSVRGIPSAPPPTYQSVVGQKD